jgi:hypothetical protein
MTVRVTRLLEGLMAGYLANLLFSQLGPRPRVPAPAPGAAPPAPPAPSSAARVAPTRTGGETPAEWARSRLAAAQAWLLRMGIATPEHAREVATSLVAQWAHETGNGKSEYNFNLGGWLASGNRPFHVLRNATTGELMRWEAFPDLDTSIAQHIERLRSRPRYARAFRALLELPTSPAWIHELGRAGYYGSGDRDVYARAWQAHRRALERMRVS